MNCKQANTQISIRRVLESFSLFPSKDNSKDLYNLPVPIPNEKLLKKIDKIYNNINKKIQLLHQINDNLAELSPNNKKTLKRVFLFIPLILVHSLA